MEWREDLNKLREIAAEKAAEKSELAKGAKEVGEDLAELPD